jgi:uncharacterized protein YjbI with pentapeptide repeats
MDIKNGTFQLDCEDADISGSFFNRITFLNSSIENADMSRLKVNECTMKQAQWTDVDCTGIVLGDINFSNASFANCTFEGATIDGVPFDSIMAAYRSANP